MKLDRRSFLKVLTTALAATQVPAQANVADSSIPPEPRKARQPKIADSDNPKIDTSPYVNGLPVHLKDRFGNDHLLGRLKKPPFIAQRTSSVDFSEAHIDPNFVFSFKSQAGWGCSIEVDNPTDIGERIVDRLLLDAVEIGSFSIKTPYGLIEMDAQVRRLGRTVSPESYYISIDLILDESPNLIEAA